MALTGYEALERTIAIDDLPADADALKYAVMHVPAGRRFTVDAAYVSAQADVSAADTNYNTLFLRNNSLTSNEIARLENGDATDGTDVTQTPVEMGTGTGSAWLQGSYAAAQIVVGSDSADTTIFLTATKTGTGQAIAGLKLHLVGRWTK